MVSHTCTLTASWDMTLLPKCSDQHHTESHCPEDCKHSSRRRGTLKPAMIRHSYRWMDSWCSFYSKDQRSHHPQAPTQNQQGPYKVPLKKGSNEPYIKTECNEVQMPVDRTGSKSSLFCTGSVQDSLTGWKERYSEMGILPHYALSIWSTYCRK